MLQIFIFAPFTFLPLHKITKLSKMSFLQRFIFELKKLKVFLNFSLHSFILMYFLLSSTKKIASLFSSKIIQSHTLLFILSSSPFKIIPLNLLYFFNEHPISLHFLTSAALIRLQFNNSFKI